MKKSFWTIGLLPFVCVLLLAWVKPPQSSTSAGVSQADLDTKLDNDGGVATNLSGTLGGTLDAQGENIDDVGDLTATNLTNIALQTFKSGAAASLVWQNQGYAPDSEYAWRLGYEGNDAGGLQLNKNGTNFVSFAAHWNGPAQNVNFSWPWFAVHYRSNQGVTNALQVRGNACIETNLFVSNNIYAASMFATGAYFVGEATARVFRADAGSIYLGTQSVSSSDVDDWRTAESRVDQDVTSGSSPTLDGANISGVTGEVSEALFVAVRKGSAGTITAGAPVYVTGYNASGWTEVEQADADDPAKMPAIGVHSGDIDNTATINLVVQGKRDAMDTSQFTAGTNLYVDADGNLTDSRPTAGGTAVQKLGKVLRSHASLGVIELVGALRANDVPNGFGLNGNEISELGDPTNDTCGVSQGYSDTNYVPFVFRDETDYSTTNSAPTDPAQLFFLTNTWSRSGDYLLTLHTRANRHSSFQYPVIGISRSGAVVVTNLYVTPGWTAYASGHTEANSQRYSFSHLLSITQDVQEVFGVELRGMSAGGGTAGYMWDTWLTFERYETIP